MDFCNVTVTGRLTKDPEVKTFSSGSVCNASVACNSDFRNKDNATFFKVEVWGKQGDAMAAHFKKGDPILINGGLVSEEYEGKTYLTIKNASFQFFGGSKSEGDFSGGSDSSSSQTKPVEKVSIDEISDDEIPF